MRWVTKTRVGLPAAINAGILLSAKTIAATLLDLLTEPALLHQAQDEFVERTGGGTKWVAPLLPKHFVPPVDLRWPDTSRPRAARNGGSRPQRPAPAVATRSEAEAGRLRMRMPTGCLHDKVRFKSG
jgi:hypothetical protein